MLSSGYFDGSFGWFGEFLHGLGGIYVQCCFREIPGYTSIHIYMLKSTPATQSHCGLE